MVKDNRKLEGCVCEFNTNGTDSVYKKYDKTDCRVVERVSEDEYDFEDVGTMWRIVFHDGQDAWAFADELKY